MKVLFCLLAVLAFVPNNYAQKVVLKGNEYVVVEDNKSKKSDKAIKTAYLYKGLPIWIGPKGGIYVVKVSKKTGKEYHDTNIPEPIRQDICKKYNLQYKPLKKAKK